MKRKQTCGWGCFVMVEGLPAHVGTHTPAT